MPGFFQRLFRRRDVFDELEEIQVAIDRGEDVSDRVIQTEQRKVVLSAFADAVGPRARTAYIPRTIEVDIGAGSGFGGLPFHAQGVDHPICPNCRRPMPPLPTGYRSISSHM